MDDYVFKVKTATAKFRVKFSKDMAWTLQANGDRERILVGYTVTLGGNAEPECLQINVPLKGDTGTLLWLKSSVGCALEIEGEPDTTEIKGDLTQHMAHVGFTIARKMNTSLRYLTLQDSAMFNCVLPDGGLYPMNMTDHELAFYQQTYYERRYGSKFVLKGLQSIYESLLPNFTDPAKKPTVFKFNVSALDDELQSLYLSTRTWKEFFDRIRITYGKKKCQVIYPWIKDALFLIFEHHQFSGFEHRIDLDTRPAVRISRSLGGGGATRRRHRRAAQAAQAFPASPPQLAAMDWREFLLPTKEGRISPF